MRITKPTWDDAVFVAANLRTIDRYELQAAEGRHPQIACMEAYSKSDMVIGIEGDDGQPCGLAGVNGHYIWMLGTEALTATASHRRQLARGAREWINAVVQERLQSGAVLLHNWVCARNLESVRWLKSLGFEVFTPEPHGPSCQLFHYFRLKM
jgi:hypothetical protein